MATQVSARVDYRAIGETKTVHLVRYEPEVVAGEATDPSVEQISESRLRVQVPITDTADYEPDSVLDACHVLVEATGYIVLRDMLAYEDPRRRLGVRRR